LVFVQPVAVDRAILFWLSYKNAWEYWTEQRLNLNKEVLAATEQVLEKVPISQITSHLSSQQVGTLFLQLNVQDIGICIPFLSPADIWAANTQLPSSKLDVGDSRGAIVATVESSSVSACSAGSTVSTGKFTGKSIENVGKTKLHKIVGVTTLFLTQKIGEMTHNTIKKVYRIGFELIFFHSLLRS
jgi:hypothetical protein